MRKWSTVDAVPTDDGVLELRHDGSTFIITIAGRVLMSSTARRSEEALATLGCATVRRQPAPRVLIGGLGMAWTLRAALDTLPPAASVTVAELTPTVLEWCRGPLAPVTNGAVHDPRASVVLGDVAKVIADSPPHAWDAILLDLYEGPHAATQRRDDPFYGRAALSRSHRALAPGGTFAVWAEDPDPGFPDRMKQAGFTVSTHRVSNGGRTHIVYEGVAKGRRQMSNVTP
ncbi:MAG: spermidine synthase [Myxococcota bacterium]